MFILIIYLFILNVLLFYCFTIFFILLSIYLLFKFNIIKKNFILFYIFILFIFSVPFFILKEQFTKWKVWNFHSRTGYYEYFAWSFWLFSKYRLQCIDMIFLYL